jgi:uncharacterized protein YndB with AHSA1/START domain
MPPTKSGQAKASRSAGQGSSGRLFGPLRMPGVDMAARTVGLRQSYFYRTTPRRVFAALTEPDQIVRWFLARAELPLEKGATYRFEWAGGYSHTGHVLDVVRDRRLKLEWPNAAGSHRFLTQVTFTLRRAGVGTFLTVDHRGFPRTPTGIAQYGGTQSGWAYYLLNLRSVLEFDRDLRSPRDG